MNHEELRQHPEYRKCVDIIKGYRKGFILTMNYSNIPVKKGNALKVVLRDCVKDGLLECVSMGLDIHGNLVEEVYKRL